MPKAILAVILAAFGALTLYVIAQVGVLNIFVHNLNHPAGWQVFADLVIALLLVLSLLWKDAKAQGRHFWAWGLLTLVVGSFGPLLYLLSSQSLSHPSTDSPTN